MIYCVLHNNRIRVGFKPKKTSQYFREPYKDAHNDQ